MSKNKSKSLSWDAFQAMGNPDNPELKEDEVAKEEILENNFNHLMDVRIWLDKKNRRGKKATIIKGLDLDNEQLKSLTKKIKSHCGVGGSAKDGEVIIQGDQRKKVLTYLIDKGFKKAKLAGG